MIKFFNIGYLYLTDLGIAKLYRKDKTIVDSSGTPGYMSPEVIINQPHDLCSDFFAIGVMLHEFMFCKRPYVGKSRKEIKDQIEKNEKENLIIVTSELTSPIMTMEDGGDSCTEQRLSENKSFFIIKESLKV